MSDNAARAAQQGLGRAIEVRRVHLGLKRKDLAEKAKLSYPYISELENGGKEPSAKALRQIADALDMGVAELIAMGEQYRDADEHGGDQRDFLDQNVLRSLLRWGPRQRVRRNAPPRGWR